MGVKYSNLARSTVLSAIAPGDTTFSVAAGTGVRFPVLTVAGDYCYLALTNAAKQTELVKATTRAGDTFSVVVRAQGGTTAIAFAAGDSVRQVLIAEALALLVKSDEDNTLLGKNKFTVSTTFDKVNFAAATAVGDAYSVTLDPAPTAISDGTEVKIRMPSANSTTTPSLNANTLGAWTITKGGAQPLLVGDLVINSEITLRKVTRTGTPFWEIVSGVSVGGQKPAVLDHGTKNGNYTLDLSLAELHLIAFTAGATLSIMSSFTNDRAMVVIKNGGNAIAVSGIDNDTPTLTNAGLKQDMLAIVKSFGKISCVGQVLNRTAV